MSADECGAVQGDHRCSLPATHRVWPHRDRARFGFQHWDTRDGGSYSWKGLDEHMPSSSKEGESA